MNRLTTRIDPASATFRANVEVNRRLAQQLRERSAAATLGGPEASRSRHVRRGKLLPRERVERLLDPGSPFLEVGGLAAFGLYDGEIGRAHV